MVNEEAITRFQRYGVQVAAGVVGVVLLVSCGASGKSATGRSDASSPSMVATSGPTSPSPSSVSSPTPADLPQLTCRLPVMAATAADQEDELGWITFPSGQYKRERAVGQSGPGNLFSDHQSLSYD